MGLFGKSKEEEEIERLQSLLKKKKIEYDNLEKSLKEKETVLKEKEDMIKKIQDESVQKDAKIKHLENEVKTLGEKLKGLESSAGKADSLSYPSGTISEKEKALAKLENILNDFKNKLQQEKEEFAVKEQAKEKIKEWKSKGYNVSQVEKALDGLVSDLQNLLNKFESDIAQMEIAKLSVEAVDSYYNARKEELKKKCSDPSNFKEVMDGLSQIAEDIERKKADFRNRLQEIANEGFIVPPEVEKAILDGTAISAQMKSLEEFEEKVDILRGLKLRIENLHPSLSAEIEALRPLLCKYEETSELETKVYELENKSNKIVAEEKAKKEKEAEASQKAADESASAVGGEKKKKKKKKKKAESEAEGEEEKEEGEKPAETTSSTATPTSQTTSQTGTPGTPVDVTSSPPQQVSAGAAAQITTTSQAQPSGDDFINALNKAYTFENFVVGDSNHFAHAAALAVAEAPATAYNPFFVYGGPGLGKTHLICAIGNRILQTRPNMKVAYVTTEKFTNELINAIGSDKVIEFRNKYRSVDVLIVDDVQFLAGKEKTQDEFFHTFNALHNAHKQIILSGDRPPKAIPTLEERLVSRFEWGLITDVQPPDLETRIAILRRKVQQMNIVMPNEVVVFIATNIKTNIRELEGAMNKVVAFSRLMKVEITLEQAKNALRDVIKMPEPQKKEEAMVLCPVCGKQVASGTNTCPFCSTPLDLLPAEKPVIKQKETQAKPTPASAGSTTPPAQQGVPAAQIPPVQQQVPNPATQAISATSPQPGTVVEEVIEEDTPPPPESPQETKEKVGTAQQQPLPTPVEQPSTPPTPAPPQPQQPALQVTQSTPAVEQATAPVSAATPQAASDDPSVAATQAVDKVSNLINNMQNEGVDVSLANNLLRLAKSFLRSKNYQKALQYAEKAENAAKEQKK